MMRPMRRGFTVLAGLAAAALPLALAGCASSGSTEAAAAGSGGGPPEAAAAVPASGPALTEGEAAAASAAELAERWGVEVVGVRLTAAGHMLDARYKVLDPVKAVPLFDRHTKAFLIHLPSGTEIPVYSPAKVGPMRSTNAPQAGRIYFIFFSNPLGMVKQGDPVTFKIGDFEAAAAVE